MTSELDVLIDEILKEALVGYYATIHEKTDGDFSRWMSYDNHLDIVLYNHPRREWIHIIAGHVLAKGQGIKIFQKHMKERIGRRSLSGGCMNVKGKTLFELVEVIQLLAKKVINLTPVNDGGLESVSDEELLRRSTLRKTLKIIISDLEAALETAWEIKGVL